METSVKSKSLFQMLNDGEKIECGKCHNGFYVPDNPSVERNTFFRCNNCDAFIEFELGVIVE